MEIRFTKKYVNWHIGQLKNVSESVAEKLIKAGVAVAASAQSAAKAITEDTLENKAIESSELTNKKGRKKAE